MDRDGTATLPTSNFARLTPAPKGTVACQIDSKFFHASSTEQVAVQSVIKREINQVPSIYPDTQTVNISYSISQFFRSFVEDTGDEKDRRKTCGKHSCGRNRNTTSA
jgi:hypothetical protein